MVTARLSRLEPLPTQKVLGKLGRGVGVLPVRGNHDDDSPERLAEIAETATRQRRDQVRAAQLDRLASAPPALTVIDLDLIERAAAEGAIDTLFVDADWRRPVTDAGTAATVPDRGDELVRRALETDATIASWGRATVVRPGRK